MMNESTESKRRRKLTEEYLETKLKDMLLTWLCRQTSVHDASWQNAPGMKLKQDASSEGKSFGATK